MSDDTFNAAAYRRAIGADTGEATGDVGTVKPTARSSLAAGQLIGRYELIRSLGAGGMGEVFLARDVRLGRRVAIKFVQVTDDESGQRFLEEARSTARCNHENIVVIHEADVFAGWHYLVLEYLQGQSLSELLRDGTALPAARAVELALPVVRALARAHDEGIVHCDLKPDNVLVTTSGTVKVLDFGISRALGAGVDAHALGTRSYMSPEQWRHETLDASTDLWSLGMLLFRMLAGRHPLLRPDGDPAALASVAGATPMPALQSMAVGVPPGLAKVVDRCLRKDKGERFSSARELLAALEPFEAARVVHALKVGETPYAGLSSFQEADAARFFGRAKETVAFVARLRTQPLMAVVGSSGAGKSSFVRAGVLPALKRAGERWRVLVMRPSRRPFDALVDAVLELEGEATGRDALVELVRREPGTAGARLRAHARTTGERVLLFVDQLEELFTHGVEAAERHAFTTALLGIADDAASPSRVVLSVRNDFLDRVGEDHRFIGELSAGLFFLAAPGRDGLREALVGPAELAGYRFEHDEVIDEMLAHLAATPGALPLLQFTASQLWDARDEGRRLLTTESYRALGGISGALAAHADRVVGELPAASQAVARTLLTSLVTTERTRAVLTLAELEERGGSAAAVAPLVDQLVRARLLVVQTHEGATTVELVHESLITAWPLLRRWLDEGREDQAFREQVRAAARQWDARGREAGLLWRGDALAEAKLWRSRHRDDLPGRDGAFLTAVLAEGDRQVRRRRAVVVGVIVTLSLVVVGGAVALVQVRRAERHAVEQAELAGREAERAGREAERARTAEAQVSEQLAQLKREQAAKVAAEAAVEQGKGDLKVANAQLEVALEKARAESAHARDAAARANELAGSLKTANAALQKLLAEERRRIERLEQERKKITTELK